MPYYMKKVGDKFCVFNKNTDANKGCSDTRDKAIKHMRALYAAEGKTFSELDTVVDVKTFFDEATLDQPQWIQVFPYGHWPHPLYTDTTINKDRAERLVKNFKENVRRIEITTDYEHGTDKAKGNKASGVFTDLELREDGVWGAVKWTPTAASEIKAGEWKYFSGTMLDVWHDDETDETFEDVLIGGGLTNRPWMKDRVPLNFSEVAVADSKEGLRFRIGNTEGDEVGVSKDGGETWHTATKDEVVEWEHSEPGTGPQPRADEDDRSGDKDGSGSRRGAPPPEPDRPLNQNGEGSVVNRDELVAFAKAIGITVDDKWDDATLGGKIKEQGEKLFSENATLTAELDKARENEDKAKKFAEEFPEEAARMKHLEEQDNLFQAKVFSERYSRTTKTEGEGDNAKTTTTKRGLSAVALNKVQEMHKAFAEGNANVKMFGELMDTLNSDGAFVDFGERGSSREDPTEEIPTERLNISKQFSEKVEEIKNKGLAEGKVIAHGDAVSQAAKDHPALWKAYTEAPTPFA